MKTIIIATVAAFASAAVIMPVLIPFLRRLKFGQQILEEGPEWHKKKQGTPTMGGIGIIAAVLISALIAGIDKKAWLLFGFAFLCGAVGFADDYIKVCKKRNMGFSALQKTACLIVAMILFIVICRISGYTDTSIKIPFSDKSVNLSWGWYPLIVLALLGGINSVNLTDGIDGLAASVTAVVMIFFTIISYMAKNAGMSALSAAVLGALLGFLIYNLNPARVFMGDTGSLFLGGLVSGAAVMLKNPLLLIIVGFVYFAEALSVILQVASFQLTGKRIFKMSPIHHHFEMSGWNENKIVTVFTALTAILCIISFFGV